MRLQAIILAVTVLVTSQAAHPRERRQYSNGADAAYRRDSSQLNSRPSPLTNIKRCVNVHQLANGQARCAYSGCRLRCLPGYHFIGTERNRKVTLSCDHHTGELNFRGEVWSPKMTTCSPFCGNTCQNGGTCSAPDTCSCQSGYTGKFCETERMLGDSPYGGYQIAELNKNQRRVECPDGTRMPDGSTSVTMTYKDGHYFYPDGRILLGVEKVTCSQVFCANTCENGGTCSAPDTCSCQSGYTGKFCEAEIIVDDAPEDLVLPEHLNQRRVECPDGKRMPDGSTSVTLTYKNGDYFYPDGRVLVGVDSITCSQVPAVTTVPRKPLQPVKPQPSPTHRPLNLIRPTIGFVTKPSKESEYSCTPACANGGICVYTNTCSCPRGFWGNRCLTRICSYPRFESDLRASLGGTLKRLQFECKPGLRTAAGRDSVVVLCREGYWRLPDGKLMAEEDVRCY